MKKRCNYSLLIIVLFLVLGPKANAQIIYDSIVIEYFLTNGGVSDRYTLFPNGRPQYESVNREPAILVECTENVMSAIRKWSGTGIVYSENRRQRYLLEKDFLVNDSTGESYYNTILNSCIYVMNSNGDIWEVKSKDRDSISEGYAICRIIIYNKFINGHRTITTYQFDHYYTDVFRNEYQQMLTAMYRIKRIPQQY